MRIVWILGICLGWLVISCGDEGARKGTLRLSITDAPIDASHIQAVNLVITGIEVKARGEWRTISSLREPISLNLLDYTGGKAFPLLDNQVVEPGTLEGIRLRLNMVNPDAGFVVNPHGLVRLQDGSQQPLRMTPGLAHEILYAQPIPIRPGERTDLTLDVDARKSVDLVNGHFEFTPVFRMVETARTGGIAGQLLDASPTDRMLVAAYRTGSFTASETVRGIFPQAVTSVRLNRKAFTLAFLENGSYDLVFARLKSDGSVEELLGRITVQIQAGSLQTLDITLAQLTP